ncbi:MAG: hypothetical protein VCC36_07445 [Gammaproteobacteria bacterium]
MRERKFLQCRSATSPFIALLVSLSVFQTGFSQEPAATEPETLTEVTIDQRPLPMEELTVVAPQSLQSMRDGLVRAEDDVLAVFNDLNDDNDFDIYCVKETPTLSYIPIRVCRARFVDRLTAQAASDFLGGSAYDDPRGQLSYYGSLLRQKMSELVDESPDLYQALLAYYELKIDYDDERGERFDGKFLSR